MNTPDPITSDRGQSASDRLNQTCLCVTLDRVALGKALEREARDPAFVETFIRPRPYLFSNVPVFLSADAVAEMQECRGNDTAPIVPSRRSILGAADRAEGSWSSGRVDGVPTSVKTVQD